MNLLRPLLVLGVIVSAVWLGGHVAHHEDPDVFQTLFSHLAPAPLEFQHGHALSIDVPAFLNVFTLDSEAHPTGKLMVTNLQVFQVAAVVLILLCFIGVPRHIKTGDGDAVSRLFAGWCKWIRDEMIYPVMGPDRGGKFMPFFLSIFFFILFMNLLGLVPGGATATASIFVTCALALITLVAMLVCGMVAQGPIKFWLNLVPHVPLPLWPLMFVIEVFGLFLKPFALMVRLFANMTGGHLIVLTCMGLIMFFAEKGGNAALGYGVALPAVGFGVFIMIIEVFVALLQAYVFTMLSILFVNVSVHPEH